MSAISQALLASLKAAASGPNFIASAPAIITTAATTLTINKPAGTIDGDLMIALIQSGSAVTWTGDTGWTEVLDPGISPSMRVAWKNASGEGASYTFTQSTSREASGFILTFRGAAYDTVGAQVVLINDGNVVASQITSAGGILIGYFAANSVAQQTFTTPTNMALVGSISDALSEANSYVFSQTVAAGATGSRTSAASLASSTNGGLLIGVKAA